MRKSLLALVGGLALLAAPGLAQAAHVEVDPNKDYRVTPEIGPWMVCAHYYTGPTAPELARELVLMLRQRDNLPAYVFVHGEEEKRKQQEYLQQLHQLCPDVRNLRVRRVRVEEEYAVLIGGYPDIDSAHRVLEDVKRLKAPDAERLMDTITTVEPTKEGKGLVKKAHVNPFVTSFVARNPTVPPEKADRSKPDPALKELNAGRPYNLMRCGHPWTLVIKDFQGAAMLQSQSSGSAFLSAIGFGGRSNDLLAASAKQAEEVARVLRELKFDAYVLHTRTTSVVTIGGFDRQDDPRLLQMQRQMANLKLGPIQCFAQPLPMQVPVE